MESDAYSFLNLNRSNAMALDTSKKTLYHSALVQEGEVTVTVMSEKPQKSKYQGKPDWVGLKYGNHEFTYAVENEACGEALTGLKGQTVQLIAHGSREDATIEILGDATPPPRQQQQKPAQNQQRTAPPAAQAKAPADSGKAFQSAKVYMAQVSVLMEMAMKASTALCSRVLPNATTEDVRAIAATIFIESKGMVTISALPVKYPDPSAPPVKKPEPPPPPPEPEPPAADDLAPENIPF